MGHLRPLFLKKTSIQFHIILMIKMVHLISRVGFELTITWTRVSYHHLSTIRDFRPLQSVFPTWSLWSKVQLKFTTISLKQLVKHTFSTTQFIKKIDRVRRTPICGVFSHDDIKNKGFRIGNETGNFILFYDVNVERG